MQRGERSPSLTASAGMLSLLLPIRWNDPCTWLCEPFIDKPAGRLIEIVRGNVRTSAFKGAVIVFRKVGLVKGDANVTLKTNTTAKAAASLEEHAKGR